LLNILTIVSSILFGNVCVRKLMNNNFLSDMIPVFICLFSKYFSHFIGYSKGLHSDCISKGIIVNILCPLVGCNNIVDMISSIFVNLYSALPELGCSLNDWSPFGLKPLFILRYTIIFPCCYSNSSGDMMFKWSWSSPYRTLFFTRFRALPWEHCAFVTVEESVIFSCLKPFISILY